MTSPRAVVQVEQLSKTFRIPHVEHMSLRGRILHPFDRTTVEEFQALDDVSFEIHEGEFFGIVGRNGSGKSTLLKVLAGIYRPDAGSVRVDGTVAPFIELGVGFNPELSGRDNVFINGALLGLSRARIEERFEHIVEFAELERFMDLKLRNFSSGMQVRLAFAIALEAGAEILLTDEVLAVGDENFQRKCFDVFRARKREGRTVVFVTHDMSAILDFCDRTLLLDRGRVDMIGDTREVVRRYHGLNQTARDASTSAAGDADAATERPAAEIDATHLITEDDLEIELAPQHQRLGIRVRTHINRRMVDPIIGIILTDHLGKQVMLANTLWSDRPTGTWEADELLETTFWFENVLAGGDYVVRSEVAESSAGPVLDLVPEALRFTVHSPLMTGGVIDLPLDISVQRVDSLTAGRESAS